MAKNPELVVKLDKPLKREVGYMYYLAGNAPKDGIIAGIFRSKMVHGRPKKA